MKVAFSLFLFIFSFMSNATTVVEIPHKFTPTELHKMGFVRIENKNNLEHEWIVVGFPSVFKESLKPQVVNAIFKRHGEEIITTPLKVYNFDSEVSSVASFSIRKNDNIEVEIEISYGHDMDASDRVIIGNIDTLTAISFSEYEKIYGLQDQQ